MKRMEYTLQAKTFFAYMTDSIKCIAMTGLFFVLVSCTSKPADQEAPQNVVPPVSSSIEPNTASMVTEPSSVPLLESSAESKSAPYLPPEDQALEPTDLDVHKTIGTFEDWVKGYQGIGSPESNLKPPRLGLVKDIAVKSGHLAFSRSGDIFTRDFTTGVETQLTRKTQRNQSPTFLADGKRIAFLSNRDGMAWRVFLMNADGTSQRPITRKFASLYDKPSYAITSDGVHAAYLAVEGPPAEWHLQSLHLVDVATSDDQRIGELDDFDKPIFVPRDPTMLYVVAGRLSERYIISVDITTKRIKKLPSAGNYLFSSPRKIGNRLLYASGATGVICCGESKLFTTNLDGADIKQLGSFAMGGSVQPEISPHGSKIAVAWSVREGGFGADWRNEITVVDADGTMGRSLSGKFPRPFYSALEPAWAPDDRHIAFTLSLCPYVGCKPTIRSVVVTDSKNPKGALAFIGNGGEPSWSPVP